MPGEAQAQGENMSRKNWWKLALVVGAIGGVAYAWERSQRKIRALPTRPPHGNQLLARAAPLIRLPTSPHLEPEVLADGSGLRCTRTGRIYPYKDGILDLMDPNFRPTAAQRMLDRPLTSWAYERSRSCVLKVLGAPSFRGEVNRIQERLKLEPGDTVLDLACGHGIFTTEWAKRVGPAGLVIGIDISPHMLARAALAVFEWGVDNVLLIRADALELPLASSGLQNVNCSAGFHQIPDLPLALSELSRVMRPDAILTASTLAEGFIDRTAGLKRWLRKRMDLHFVPIEWLNEQMTRVGFSDFRWHLPGGWFGYTSARKRALPPEISPGTEA